MSDSYISAALRREVTERANNCCEYCRLSQDDSFFTFHVDHIISQKHGGETVSENLCLSCPSCNITKGSDIDLYQQQTITFAELDASINGWVNHVRYADTWGLRRHIFQTHPIPPPVQNSGTNSENFDR